MFRDGGLLGPSFLLNLLIRFLDGAVDHPVGGVPPQRDFRKGGSREHALPKAYFPLELWFTVLPPFPSVRDDLPQPVGAVEFDRVETFHGALERWLEALACFH
jgi:hypothetical protein